MNNQHTYIDHNATTRLDPRVLEVMLPYMSDQYGNATSRHVYGRSARQAIERAREQVADAVEAHPSQIVFTASGTESNNFIVRGIAALHLDKALAISAIEHPCVTKPAEAMRQIGCRVNTIAVSANGLLSTASLQSCLTSPTSLVSAMLANNETGVMQPVAEMAELAKQHGALMHTDAVQVLGKMPVSFSDLNVDAMTISSHKIGGPQGAGALVLDKRIDIQPLMMGGGQEKGLRSGTENLAAIVGFGAACELIKNELKMRSSSTQALREQLEAGLKQLGASIFGNSVARLPNTSFFAFEGIEGETMLLALDRKGYAIASGSACSSDSTEPSHVLLAMGVEEYLARGALRVSFASQNTSQEVDGFLLALASELTRLKQMTAIAV
ncbi:MAG TPA: cysteine desulfurase family protein [Methylophilaceae bacterium]